MHYSPSTSCKPCLCAAGHDPVRDAHHEAESTFSAGIIRYEQHGKGATRGGAAAFKKRNRGSCLVDTLHIHELLGAEVWRATLVEFVGCVNGSYCVGRPAFRSPLYVPLQAAPFSLSSCTLPL